MKDLIAPIVDEATPQEAWGVLAQDHSTILVDVRSRPEWTFAGLPDLTAIGRDLVTVEWETWPTMAPNLGFLSDLEQELDVSKTTRIFFMCRAGSRSINAAREVARQMHARGRNVHVTNVCEGFEGDQDDKGQRGKVNGWKAAGLPWRQA
ncbi:MAG: rhodanese-like domain-containing protein [Pseudomonadota bacterium]